LAGVLGGLVVYIWGSISWVALPWHNVTLNKFSNEAEVAEVIINNANKDGIYILPNPHNYDASLSAEAIKQIEQQGIDKMKQGPFVFTSIKLNGSDPMSPTPYIAMLLSEIIAAIIIGLLLSLTRGLSYLKRVGFVTSIGVVAALLGYIPNIIWWGFDVMYTLVFVADLTIGWFLGGLVIARFINPDDSISTS